MSDLVGNAEGMFFSWHSLYSEGHEVGIKVAEKEDINSINNNNNNNNRLYFQRVTHLAKI